MSPSSTLLLATDRSRTPLTEHAAQTRRRAYTVHGYQMPAAALGRAGFNGEIVEQGGVYLLGSHRTYNPALMRFHTPDSLSPFARGGLNTYAYCLGDPVNRVDPTGHVPEWVLPAIGIGLSFAGVGLAMAGAYVATSYTGGLFAMHMTSAALGGVGAGAGMASILLTTQSESKTGEILGYVSLGLGVASMLTSMTALAVQARAAKTATSKKVSALNGTSKTHLRQDIQDLGGTPREQMPLSTRSSSQDSIPRQLDDFDQQAGLSDFTSDGERFKSAAATKRNHVERNTPAGVGPDEPERIGSIQIKLGRIRKSAQHGSSPNLPY